MDLEAEFYKETKMKAQPIFPGRYANNYVEWLEKRVEYVTNLGQT